MLAVRYADPGHASIFPDRAPTLIRACAERDYHFTSIYVKKVDDLTSKKSSFGVATHTCNRQIMCGLIGSRCWLFERKL